MTGKTKFKIITEDEFQEPYRYKVIKTHPLEIAKDICFTSVIPSNKDALRLALEHGPGMYIVLDCYPPTISSKIHRVYQSGGVVVRRLPVVEVED